MYILTHYQTRSALLLDQRTNECTWAQLMNILKCEATRTPTIPKDSRRIADIEGRSQDSQSIGREGERERERERERKGERERERERNKQTKKHKQKTTFIHACINVAGAPALLQRSRTDSRGPTAASEGSTVKSDRQVKSTTQTRSSCYNSTNTRHESRLSTNPTRQAITGARRAVTSSLPSSLVCSQLIRSKKTRAGCTVLHSHHISQPHLQITDMRH